MTGIKFPFQNIISLTVMLKTMYLETLKTSLTRLCLRTGQALRCEEKSKSFEVSFHNMNFLPFTSILLNFFFPFIDISCFFSSLKLQHFRTKVLLDKAFQRNLFFKNDDGHAICSKKNVGCPKAPRDFRQEKMAFSTPCRGLPPPQESVRVDITGVCGRHNHNFLDR